MTWNIIKCKIEEGWLVILRIKAYKFKWRLAFFTRTFYWLDYSLWNGIVVCNNIVLNKNNVYFSAVNSKEELNLFVYYLKNIPGCHMWTTSLPIYSKFLTSVEFYLFLNMLIIYFLYRFFCAIYSFFSSHFFTSYYYNF